MNSEGSFLLADAKVRDRLRIVSLAGGEAKGRLLGMGIAPGATLEVMSATTPGSVVIALNHQRLGLGIEIAQQIYVQPIESGKRQSAERSASAQQKDDTTVHLRDLTVGSRAQVVGYEREARMYRRKLLAMGLTRGTAFTVTRRAPLGDPVELKVRGFSLSLRKDEADALMVSLIRESESEKEYVS